MEEDFSEQTIAKEATITGSFPTVIFVRHAESIANTLGIYQGQTYDTDLSALGLKQADRLAKKAYELGIKKVVTSPLRRCYQTAIAVSKLIECPVAVDARLIEISHGDWEGMSKEWIAQYYPELYRTWKSRPQEVVFPQGESLQNVWERIDNLLQDSLLEENTMLVTHDAVIRVINCVSEGIDKFWVQELDSASLNFFELGIVEGRKRLRPLKMNETSHLKDIKSNLIKHAI